MAQLLSVNVGLPREIEWKGKTVYTAVWKDAVRGRRKLGPNAAKRTEPQHKLCHGHIVGRFIEMDKVIWAESHPCLFPFDSEFLCGFA
jgi:hypothetical protein